MERPGRVCAGVRMQIRPNKSVLDAKLARIEPSPDGWGANIVVHVERCGPARGYPDFVRGKPGAVFNMFAADVDGLIEGRLYRLDVTLIGGPGGQRLVIQKAAPGVERRTLPAIPQPHPGY